MSRVYKSSRLLLHDSRPIGVKPFLLQEDKPPSLEDVHRQAHAILEKAEQDAARIRAQVDEHKANWEATKQEEKERMAVEYKETKERAHDEGYEAGYKDGETTGQRMYETRIAEAIDIVNFIKSEKDAYLQAAETTILLLAKKIAEKVLRTSLENEAAMVPLVKDVLRELRQTPYAEIHVHPSQYERTLGEKDQLQAIFPREIDLYIYPDHSLAEGGLVVESANGKIDAGLETQLKELHAVLETLLEGDPAHEGH